MKIKKPTLESMAAQLSKQMKTTFTFEKHPVTGQLLLGAVLTVDEADAVVDEIRDKIKCDTVRVYYYPKNIIDKGCFFFEAVESDITKTEETAQ